MSNSIGGRNPYLAILLSITIILLFASLLTGLPYAYFQILRWVACATFCFGAYSSYQRKIRFLIWVFIAFAILFNPIAPIRFNRHTWELIDVATGILAIAPLVVFLRAKEIAESPKTERQS